MGSHEELDAISQAVIDVYKNQILIKGVSMEDAAATADLMEERFRKHPEDLERFRQRQADGSRGVVG